MEKYHQLCQELGFFEQNAGQENFDCIAVALHEKRQEVILTRKKVETLHSKVKNTIDLVRKSAAPDGPRS